jgi:hypothetical protein
MRWDVLVKESGGSLDDGVFKVFGHFYSRESADAFVEEQPPDTTTFVCEVYPPLAASGQLPLYR